LAEKRVIVEHAREEWQQGQGDMDEERQRVKRAPSRHHGGESRRSVNDGGRVGRELAWDWATAHVADTTLQGLIRQCDAQMIILSDSAFHTAEGDPANLKLGRRREGEDRILVETVLSMLTLVCHVTKVMHRG
jgi:hypothetical protein